MTEFSAFSSLSAVLLALGDDSLLSAAEAILALPIHRRAAAIGAARRKLAARRKTSAVLRKRAERREFDSLVFPKAVKRVTRSGADHTLRLSSSSSDSDAMTAFLANGGEIKVLPTRNSAGFKPNKARVSGGSTVTSLHKSRRAHSKVERAIRSSR